MLKYRLTGPLRGQVDVPISKSDLHRLIIAGSLSDNTTKIKGCTISDDIKATVRILEAAGANIQFKPGLIEVHPIKNPTQTPFIADCGESGSTLRFLLPVLAALGCNVTFVGEGALPKRPMLPLTSQLRKSGVKVEGDFLPIKISGKLKPGEFSISGEVSSQYVTGLLYSLPLLDNSSVIRLTSPLQSSGYVDMTLDVLSRFGIQVIDQQNSYYTKKSQKYFSPLTVTSQGDWSSAAFWLCAGAIGHGPVTIKGISYHSLQGDKMICKILREMGANIMIEDNCIACCGGNLKGIKIDAGQIPDIIPILAVTASVAEGTTQIINAGRLRIKESDRLHAMAVNLNSIGADVTELEDGLIIKGKSSLVGGNVDSFGDHRIAMSMAIIAGRCDHSIILENPLCVTKSYPDFYEDYKKLGGIVNAINLG